MMNENQPDLQIGRLISIVTASNDRCNCTAVAIYRCTKPPDCEEYKLMVVNPGCEHENPVDSTYTIYNSMVIIEWECPFCGTRTLEKDAGKLLFNIACKHYVQSGHFTNDVKLFKKLKKQGKHGFSDHKLSNRKHDLIINMSIYTPKD